MENSSPEDFEHVTQLLRRWRDGDEEAGVRFIEAVYDELHRLAAREMRRERNEHTLQTTAVVNEAYLRLCGAPVDWQDRKHFFAVAARQLRRVLVDHARRVNREKRGGGQSLLPLQDCDGPIAVADERVIAVDEALIRLAALDERAAKVVELRFFGGLTETEAAQVLDVSVATVKRDWDFAKAWLTKELA